MMHAWCPIALLLLVSVAACGDQRHTAPGPTGPDPTSLTIGKYHTSFIDTDPGRTARTPWSQFSSAQKVASIRTIEQVYAAQGEVYVRPQLMVVSDALPRLAQVLVIRDVVTPGEPMIVISRNGSDPAALLWGRMALREDAKRHPQPAGRRVLRVSSEGLVTADGQQAEERWRIPVERNHGVSGQHLLDQLTRFATSSSVVNYPGIGSGTLFRFH